MLRQLVFQLAALVDTDVNCLVICSLDEAAAEVGFPFLPLLIVQTPNLLSYSLTCSVEAV